MPRHKLSKLMVATVGSLLLLLVLFLVIQISPASSQESDKGTITPYDLGVDGVANESTNAEQTNHLAYQGQVQVEGIAGALPSRSKGDVMAWLSADDQGTESQQVLPFLVEKVVTNDSTLACNGPDVTFEQGLPTDWSVVVNTGSVYWSTTDNLTACDNGGNRTLGSGEAACADSDQTNLPPANPYDTELWSNNFDLSAYITATLEFAAFYDDISITDTFEVWISDGGLWYSELSWSEDHNEIVTLDLSAYTGLSQVAVSFRYQGDGWDWYVQVDDVSLTCVAPAIDVYPVVTELEQPQNIQETVPLTISNGGTSDLEWTIIEEPDDGRYGPPDIPGTDAGALEPQPSAANGTSSGDSTNSQKMLRPYLLLYQPPNKIDGYFSCDGCSSAVADNFMLAEDEEIKEIIIWGGYFPTNTPVAHDFTVVFHTDEADLPGTAIYTQTNVTHVREQTGEILYGLDEWKYKLTLSPVVPLDTGTYWVEIYANIETGTDIFFWETGDPDIIGNGLPGAVNSNSAPGGIWSLTPYENFALQLISTGDTCDSPSDIPWLSATPTSGSNLPGLDAIVDVTIDTTGLSIGEYVGKLCIESNDPVKPVRRVKFILNVTDYQSYLSFLMDLD